MGIHSRSLTNSGSEDGYSHEELAEVLEALGCHAEALPHFWQPTNFSRTMIGSFTMIQRSSHC
jgi:hypothetical protein